MNAYQKALIELRSILSTLTFCALTSVSRSGDFHLLCAGLPQYRRSLAALCRNCFHPFVELGAKLQRRVCFSPLLAIIVTATLIFPTSAFAAGENVRYRYKNTQGVPVISFTLPAQYAQNGYEILDSSSNVIKVVPPAPSGEDLEQAKKEKATLAAYQLLKRRYSSIDDIEKAKQRKLQNIDTNISILKGNIVNLENGVEDLVKQAAEQERAGRKVHQSILNRLSDTKAELKISVDLLEYRKQEYRNTTEKYNQDIRNFIAGEMLEKRNAEAATPSAQTN